MAARMESKTEPISSEKWECGTEYKYPVSSSGDHWQQLLEPMLEQDRLQCEKWKDEVQSLLIFAGLFSAVVTAFVILSYPNLQPDQNEIIINLLSRIAIHMDRPSTNATSLVPGPINMTQLANPITRSTIRINIFWFISLVLSLTTALIGIVSLQWLREHQQYPDTLPSRDKFALLGMRLEGLVAWYVPQIFSALPLLLQSALILYFVGLIDFLLAASLYVAIPVIIIMGIPLAFLVLTTTIPAFQILNFCLPLADSGLKVPSQSPYKSPQSRFFQHLLISSKAIFTFLAYLNHVMHYFVISLPSRLYLLIKLRQSRSFPEAEKMDPRAIDPQWIIHLWSNTLGTSTFLSFDKEWLALRNAYAKCIFDRKRWISEAFVIGRLTRVPFYDLTKAMRNTLALDKATLGYLAVKEMTSCIIGTNSKADPHHAIRVEYNLYLQNLLQLDNDADLTKPVSNFSSQLEWTDQAEPFEFIDDENLFLFLTRCDHLPSRIFQHFAELHVRIANYLYPDKTFRMLPGSRNFPDLPNSKLIYDWEDSFTGGPTSFHESVAQQFSSFVKTYLEFIADPSINGESLITALHGHNRRFVEYAIIRQSQEGSASALNFLSRRLEVCMEGSLSERSDFLFYASSFYARTLLLRDFDFESLPMNDDDIALVAPFLPILHRYLDMRGSSNLELQGRLEVPDILDEWWNFLAYTGNNCPDIPGERKILSAHAFAATQHADSLPSTLLWEFGANGRGQNQAIKTSDIGSPV